MGGNALPIVERLRDPEAAATFSDRFALSIEAADTIEQLYEALHWAFENIQGMIDDDDIPSLVIRDRARAALAKARGEQ